MAHEKASSAACGAGARALAKHCHRDVSGEWWPRMAGSEATKNEAARSMLRRLLSAAVWLNLHQLPPFDSPCCVLEVRTAQVSGRAGAQGGVHCLKGPPVCVHGVEYLARSGRRHEYDRGLAHGDRRSDREFHTLGGRRGGCVPTC
jgi:hypothetical protein